MSLLLQVFGHKANVPNTLNLLMAPHENPEETLSPEGDMRVWTTFHPRDISHKTQDEKSAVLWSNQDSLCSDHERLSKVLTQMLKHRHASNQFSVIITGCVISKVIMRSLDLVSSDSSSSGDSYTGMDTVHHHLITFTEQNCSFPACPAGAHGRPQEVKLLNTCCR